MSSHRLFVHEGSQPLAEGTCWLVREDLLVTAFHVVGLTRTKEWLHEVKSECRYLLQNGSGREWQLRPIIFDEHADLALLALDAPCEELKPLPLAPVSLEPMERWTGAGFPTHEEALGFHERLPFTLTGTVASVHEDLLQLTVDQGTHVSWKGISGAPVCDMNGEVAAVVTHEMEAVATVYATSSKAVRRLLDACDDRALRSTRTGCRLSARRISWLHISDLHHGAPNGQWSSHRDTALRDLAQQASMRGAPDLILITGDLTYSGERDEFSYVTTALHEIREAVGGDPIVVPVPGNHDLRRPPPTNIEGFRQYRHNSALREMVQRGEAEVLKPLQGWFENYMLWLEEEIVPTWRRQGVHYEAGLLPGDLRLSINRNDIHLGVVGVNSAFLQCMDGNYRGELIVEPQQAGPNLSEWIDRHHAALLIMHHPSRWLAEVDVFTASIYTPGRFVACLSGHLWAHSDELPNTDDRLLAAPSLLGRPHCDGNAKVRPHGYLWGQLDGVSTTRGRLRWWRRALPTGSRERGFGTANRPDQAFNVRLRELREPSPTPPVRSIPESSWRTVLQFSDESLQHAVGMARAGRLDAALSEFQRIRQRLEELQQDQDNDEELRGRLLDALLGEAGCMLHLQRLEGARDVVELLARELDGAVTQLTEERRILAAEAFAQTGHPERARQLIASVACDAAVVMRQVLSIIEDRTLPSNLIDDPYVRLHACWLWTEQGEHDRAAQEALRVLDALQVETELTPTQTLLRARAVQAVLAALGQSISEQHPGCAVIEEERRKRAIAVLQHYLEPRRSPLPDSVPARYVAHWAAYFHYISWDAARLSNACEWLRELGEDDSRYRAALVIDESVSTALPERMPEFLRESAPAWVHITEQVRWLSRAGRTDEALEMAIRAIGDDPTRPHLLLHREAAHLLLRAGRALEAVVHAEKAFRAFPGHGQAILLAELLYSAGQVERIWRELKEHLAESPNIEARRLLAHAASHAEPTQAPHYWQAVVLHTDANTPENAFDRLVWAQSLAVVTKLEQATEEAWNAYRSHELHMRADALAACAELHWGSSHPERMQRVHRLAEDLWDLAVLGDAQAQGAYVEFWQRLGMPADLPHPDLERWNQDGALVAMDREQIVTWGLTLAERRRSSELAYAHGMLPLELRARAEMRTHAEVFQRLVEQGHALKTPLWLHDRDVIIRNREVLLGVFELLVLDEVNVLPEFEESLGRNGRVLLFEDVFRDLILAPQRLMNRRLLHEHLEQISDGGMSERTRTAALDRARRIHSWLVAMDKAGRLQRIERPLATLPPSHDTKEAKELRSRFQYALSWREALYARPDAVLLCVDALGAESMTRGTPPVAFYSALAERTPEYHEHIWSRLETVAGRVARFTSVCRNLARPRHRERVVEALARLGFVDAFEPVDLLRRAASRSLIEATGQQLLDRIEARNSSLPPIIRMRHDSYVAMLYANCIGKAWCAAEPTEHRVDITVALLNRAMAISDQDGYRLLRQLMGLLCAYVADNPRASLALRNGVARPSLEESQAGAMWRAIIDWFGAKPESQHRRAVELLEQEAALCGMMVSEQLGDDYAGLQGQIAPLLILNQALGTLHRPMLIDPGSLLESIAILSATWPEDWRPLDNTGIALEGEDGEPVTSIEELLKQAARACLESPKALTYDGLSLRMRLDPQGYFFAFPAVAAFLRMTPEERTAFLRELLVAYGPDDGRIVPPLRRLTESPEDRDALRQYAHLSIQPPWQTSRLYPESIAQWGDPTLGRLFPTTIRELRAILSEPAALPEQGTLSDVLLQRRTEGAWKDRVDCFELLERCGEIVGAPGLPLNWRLCVDDGVNVDEVLHRLEHADDQPAARVACDLFACLLIAGATEPEAMSIRPQVGSIVCTMLEQAVLGTMPPDDSLAVCEPRLLQHALWVVSTLSFMSERLSQRDGLWLTWSLHQWMIRQFESLKDAQKKASWQKLAAMPPERLGLSWRAQADLLDPSRYGSDKLDIRLLAVLHVLAFLPKRHVRWLFSAKKSKLRSLLNALRRRPLTVEEQQVKDLQPASVLIDWGKLPQTVPALAERIYVMWYARKSTRKRNRKVRQRRRRRKR